MATNELQADNGSVEQLEQLEQRDVRALTQYLTVLDDIDRAAAAADLYMVVSQSGESYLVDARDGVCECADHKYRDVQCKHRRRVAFATGERAIPGWVERDGVDPGLGEHVDGEVRFAGDSDDTADVPTATDGGAVRERATERPGYTRDVEPPQQGGAAYWRCSGCGREILVSIGREQLIHVEDCPEGRGA